MTSSELPTYHDTFLPHHFPKDKAGLLYKHVALPWTGKLRRDDATNQIIVDAANVDLALTECPELAGLVWWETRTKRPWLFGHLPPADYFRQPENRPLNRDDITAIHIFIQRALPRIDRGTVYWCIRRVAQRYHPFRFELDDRMEGHE